VDEGGGGGELSAVPPPLGQICGMHGEGGWGATMHAVSAPS